MKGLLGDINVQGHLRQLSHFLQSDDWQELWDSLNITVRLFSDVNLAPNASDAEIWHTCQKEELILITNNRNAIGDDSLEETIRALNTPESLPVFTFANADRIYYSREYATRVVERMLEYLMDIESYRGTGRLYAVI